MKHYGDITQLSGYTLPVVDVITGGDYRVYMYEFPDKMRYVGMTKNSLEERRDSGYQHNDRLKKAMKNTGWAGISKYIIQDGLSREEAEQLEKQCIETFDTTNPKKGYNISHGGRNTFDGLHHTQEYKRRMSEIHKGKRFSEEHLLHLREAHAKERCAVYSINPDTGETIYYKSLGDAASAVRGHKSNISRSCDVKNKQYKGLLWRIGGDSR